jgi:acyl transferase domain-containing protein
MNQVSTTGSEQLSPLQKAAYALKEMRSKLDAMERSQNEPIAIIGMGCRFPGADNPEAFWQLLHNGIDAVTEIPAERWYLDNYYDPNPNAPGKMNIRHGGFLSHVDQFDPHFFGISPREAAKLDPQHRLLLEVSWEALENAGQSPKGLMGTQTGTFIGINQNDYALWQFAGDPANFDVYSTTSNGFCYASGRLSYTLGLHGPTMPIDTACSSSLVALHLACQSLRARECNLALVGGVQLLLSPEFLLLLTKTQSLSPSGRCRTFDAAADGYILGEGCGVVVLKRLSDAIANRDNILAVVLASGVNHGGASSGITVPNELAEEMLIRQVLEKAKLTSTSVKYIETHGTGTSLGDPIEVGAVGAVFGERPKDDPLVLGAVKTNIGHLDAAAGIAGLIKTVLALQHEEIPPNLHFNKPNPQIDWDKCPIKVPTEPMPWLCGDKRRVAGVSSFGITGTNAHILLEEAPVQREKSLLERPKHLLTLSAKSDKALRELVQAYEIYIKSPEAAELADLCFTANAGRSHFNHRLAVVTNSSVQLQKQLNAFVQGTEIAQLWHGELPVRSKVSMKIAFLFSGDGEQSVNMGRQLYETQTSFRQTLERCDNILRSYLDKPLLEVLYSDTSLPTAHRQAALFALEYALAELWQIWGIKPAVVMGQGVGEYVAACVAGVFNLEDGLKFIIEKERLQSLKTPRIPMISPLTGQTSNTVPDDWRQPKTNKTTIGINTLIEKGYEYFLEIGPHALTKDKDDWSVMLESLSQLYVQGAQINWEGFDKDYSRQRKPLPTYPFQRQRYWLSKEDLQPKATALPKDSQTSKVSSPSKPNQRMDTPALARIMAQQVQATSQAVSQVVSQQLEFLRSRGKTAAPKGKTKESDAVVARETPQRVGTRYHSPIAFMFPGVGDHYINMARGLYQTQSVFSKHVDECCEILLPYLKEDLREILYPKKVDETTKPRFDLKKMLNREQAPVDETTQKLNKTIFTQPAVFVIEYALAKLWLSWGIKPQAMIGYSIGEYVAACIAGVISLEEVLLLLIKRAQMIQDLPAGAMLAVPLSEQDIRPKLGEELSIATISTPSQCVVAGPPNAINDLAKKLQEQQVLCRQLQTSHAFHSKMMAPLREQLIELVSNFALKPPQIPYLSNVTGTWITDAQATDPHYWAQHTYQTVRFADGIGELLQTADYIFLEVGPGQSLGSFVFQHPAFDSVMVLPSLRTMYDGQPDAAFLLNSLGQLLSK